MLTEKDDMIVGYSSGYDFDTIKYWAHSIVKSGFKGNKVVMAGDMSSYTAKKLSNLGFIIMGTDCNENGDYRRGNWSSQWAPVVARYYILATMLQQKPWNRSRYVITTDVKDVVFQDNPSTYLEETIPWNGFNKLLVGSESMRYQDEDWGNDNMIQSFGNLVPYSIMTERLKMEIFNCGSWAGECDYVKDMALQIFLLSNASKIINPDQAAFNLLLQSNPWCDIVSKRKVEDGWAAQAGTTNDPSKPHFLPKLLEKPPVMDKETGIVRNDWGFKMTLVHQYDRNPEWKQIIQEKYGTL